jgi:hypothetical protein
MDFDQSHLSPAQREFLQHYIPRVDLPLPARLQLKTIILDHEFRGQPTPQTHERAQRVLPPRMKDRSLDVVHFETTYLQNGLNFVQYKESGVPAVEWVLENCPGVGCLGVFIRAAALCGSLTESEAMVFLRRVLAAEADELAEYPLQEVTRELLTRDTKAVLRLGRAFAHAGDQIGSIHVPHDVLHPPLVPGCWCSINSVLRY